MGSQSVHSRRAFIGLAAVGAAGVAAVAAKLAENGQEGACRDHAPHGAPPHGERELAGRRPELADQALRRAGRDDGIRRPGQRAAGRADHAVRVDHRPLVPGEGVPDGLVRRRRGQAGLAFRDRARSPAAQAHADPPHQHGGSGLGPFAHHPHPRLAGGQLPAPAGRGVGGAALRAGHRPVGQHRREDSDQELRLDLAGVQHLGRLRPVQRARRHRRLQQPRARGQPGPAVRRQRRLHVPVPRTEAHRAGRAPRPAARLR